MKNLNFLTDYEESPAFTVEHAVLVGDANRSVENCKVTCDGNNGVAIQRSVLDSNSTVSVISVEAAITKDTASIPSGTYNVTEASAFDGVVLKTANSEEEIVRRMEGQACALADEASANSKNKDDDKQQPQQQQQQDAIVADDAMNERPATPGADLVCVNCKLIPRHVLMDCYSSSSSSSSSLSSSRAPTIKKRKLYNQMDDCKDAEMPCKKKEMSHQEEVEKKEAVKKRMTTESIKEQSKRVAKSSDSNSCEDNNCDAE
jgi:hypothetical protein